MISISIVLFQSMGCLGLGAAILRGLNVLEKLCKVEQLSWSFALGMGLLGWLLFFLGMASAFVPVYFIVLLGIGSLGCIFLRPFRLSHTSLDLMPSEYALLGLLAITFMLSLFEGVAPPADGDSLAYHFALPKQFLAAGRLEFVPRAFDGAMPLLIHMTYLPPLALGEERALTLWTMSTGWVLILMFYSIARRFLDRRWALVGAFLLANTPAIIYGAGSGQLEVRLALFVLLVSVAITDLVRTGEMRYTLIAGLGIGFFIGSKYTGLFFALACAISLIFGMQLTRRRWFLHVMALTLVSTAIGAQSFLWNWLNSGDPVFPFFYGVLPYSNPAMWDAAHADQLRFYTAQQERAVPTSLFWFFAYPFAATFSGFPVFESARTGFGPFVILALPMALTGFWIARRSAVRSLILVFALIALLFYACWFTSGISQRIRHLLPVYPIVLVVILVAAGRWSDRHLLPIPLMTAAALAGFLQLSGHILYARNHAQYVLTGEGRDEFLSRNVFGYPAVAWINKNLGSSDRIFTTARQLIYLFERPVYYGHIVQDALVDLRLEADDTGRYLSQLQAIGANYILEFVPVATDKSNRPLWVELAASGCLRLVKTFSVQVFQSRTLPAMAQSKSEMALYKIPDNACSTHG